MVLANLVLWNRNQSKQPAGVTASFYPDPKFDRETPTLSKPYGSGLASVDEIKDYLQQLVVRSPGLAYMENIGVTKQGRTIPVLYLGTPDKKKVRVWIQAALHGNEPAGAEAVCMLVRYLLCEKEGRELLNHIAVALVPIANVDGYAIQQRRSADGYDLNRDQSKLEDAVTLLLKQSYQQWNPDVALDIHEYTPLRREFNLLRGVPTANAADVLFLPTGHLNAPLALRTLSEELFRREAEVVLNSAGYASGFYFTPRVADGSLVLVKGAKSPQSSSTFQALTGAVSLFVEIRGIGLGPECYARRSECGFLVARQTLVTAAQHRASIKRKIEQARKRTLKATEPIYVTFTSDTVRHVVSFIDYEANELFKTELPTLDAMQVTPQLVRTRPKAYLLDALCTEAVCKLRALGVHIEQVTRVQKAKVERYKVTRLYRAEKEWEGIHPVNVETDVYEDNVELPIGSWLVPLAQPLGNLVATLLEPESVCGFVNFCVIPAEEGKGLFVRELDMALINGNTDLSVHSLKDMPIEVATDLPIIGYSRREDARDVLVLPRGISKYDYYGPIGCSSNRRSLQLKDIYPKAEIKSVRGNVLTRLEKLDKGEYGALVLAAAGLKRLGLTERISRYFSIQEMIPAAGQGILCIQGKKESNYDFLEGFFDKEAETCALAERAFMTYLNGGCSLPIGVYAEILNEQEMKIQGLYYNRENNVYKKMSLTGNRFAPEELGIQLAMALKNICSTSL